MLLLLLLLSTLLINTTISNNTTPLPRKDFFSAKCSACVSIVSELSRNLELETPRSNIDLRNTLRSPQKTANDKDKVHVEPIPYEVSELRLLEVLEDLCKGMDQYALTTTEDGFITYQRFNAKGAGTVFIKGTMAVGGDEFNSHRSMLKNYCDYIVEEYEGEFEEAIRKAGLSKLSLKEEGAKVAKMLREGLELKDLNDVEAEKLNDRTKAYLILGIDTASSQTKIKETYRLKTKALHPDKILHSDPEYADKLLTFHEITKGHSLLTGDVILPYNDSELYRNICVEVLGVCSGVDEVDVIKGYFPKYKGSSVDGMQEDSGDVQGRLGGKRKVKGKGKEKKKRNKVKKEWNEDEELQEGGLHVGSGVLV